METDSDTRQTLQNRPNKRDYHELEGIDSGDVSEVSDDGQGSSGDKHCHGEDAKEDTLARNQLIAVSVLCFLFVVGELVGGLLAHSLAVVTDAAHLFSDLAGYLVSLLSLWLAKRPASARMSFGYHRAEVLGAMISILIIWIVTSILVYLAVKRIQEETFHIESKTMLITACVGLGFNVVMGVVLHGRLWTGCRIKSSFGHSHGHDDGHSEGDNGAHGDELPLDEDEADDSNHKRGGLLGWLGIRSKNINIRAALIHVIGDIIQSVGVLVAAVIIYVKPSYKLADPICTFIFSFLVLLTTITVLRDILLIIMDGVPRDVNYREMKSDLGQLSGVKAAHSLNVWALTNGKLAVSVHLAVDTGVDWSEILAQGTKLLRSKYKVHQSAIQIEHYQEDVMLTCTKCQVP